MKKPKFLRLRLALGLVPGRSRRRGVAIITVLAIISLMTILIISFFNMAQTQKTTAIGTVEMQRVVTLKDTIMNLVMGQIRQATTLPGPSPQSQTIWTSQPGAIRTYHGTDTGLNRLYKLYSSDKMMIDGIVKDTSASLLNELERDIETKWDEFPDMFVDINRPVRPSDSAKDEESPTEVRKRLIYPIVDPSRYNGQESGTTENTEGFTYGEKSLSARAVNGVDAAKGQLSMPVRWVYMLEDGTFGTLDKAGKFASLSKDDSEPTKLNPIVSRIAWWTDDETCKINVNTASLPIPWDTPRTNSYEDIWYAQHQPVSGEVHHYPSHPAQTDLTAVFFPGYRYSPDTKAFPLGEHMSNLPTEYAKLIWNMSPYITEEGGSKGGTATVNILTVLPVPLDNNDHLYATFEEIYFKARNAEKNLNRPRDTVSKDDNSGKFLARLEASQFFLSTRSNGPEMTIRGTPRVCLFPMNENVKTEVGKLSGAVNPQIGAFEVTMATNCTLGAALGVPGKPFYFQRGANSTSRHNAFYNSSDGRNLQMLKYLKKLTVSVPPGYPELEKEFFNTFGKKYPGPNGKNGDNPGVPDFDSSDRTQILVSMLDMLRSSNMAPGYLESGQSYDNGNGQVSGICGCQNKGGDTQTPHTTAMRIDPVKTAIYTPKGSGRTYGPAEICFFAHVTAVKKGTQLTGVAAPISNPTMNTKWAQTKAGSLVQLGVLINSFSPRQGWAPMFGESGINLSGKTQTSGSDPRTATTGLLETPFVFAQASPESPFFFGTNVNGSSPAPTGSDPPVPLPPNFVPWAGIGGARVTATQTVATFDPFVYEGFGAGGTAPIPVQLKWRPGEVLRIFIYEGAPADYNTNQAIELEIGANVIELKANFTGKLALTLLKENISQPTSNWPPAKLSMTSFVVPHGDYRLTTTPLRVERGIFVPHGTGHHSIVEPNINGRNASYVKCAGAAMAPPNEQLLSDSKITPMKEEYAPHLAPVNQTYLCNAAFGVKPMDNVIAAASGNPVRRLRYAHGRRDGQYAGPLYQPFITANSIPNRLSSDPLETGDFDQGVGLCPDGPYMNQPDDGDVRDPSFPYYQSLSKKAKVNPASFSPNRVFRSAVDFGSIPSGLQARVPWQTLRFRPDPGMGSGATRITELTDKLPEKPAGYQHFFPFSNYCGPKDHLLLDMFWMPVVEPWAISEGFATKGLINLNQQIFPFTYINRTTALHALLRSERMMAIPDTASNDYKNGTTVPDTNACYRHWINAKETLKQLVDFRWRGLDAEGFTVPFNSFRSASEICELWLVPEQNSTGNQGGGTWNLNYIVKKFWDEHRLTGDNSRERPYANLYPRLTVRSNVYKVHMIAQTLKKASTNEPDSFTTQPEEGKDPDLVTAEWRGSALLERVINPNEPELRKAANDYAPALTEKIIDGMNVVFPPKLDNYYTYRVTEVKQMTE